jgi:hypothetical protein
LKGSEDRLLGEYLDPREETIKGWRKLRKEEVQNFLSSEYSLKDMKCAEHVARKEKNEKCIQNLVVKLEGKRQLGKITLRVILEE